MCQWVAMDTSYGVGQAKYVPFILVTRRKSSDISASSKSRKLAMKCETLIELSILFCAQKVKTLGYVAIGFSPNGGMKGADIALGWVNDNDGKVHLLDMKATSNGLAPEIDSNQDLQLISGHQNDTHTTITFQRPWQTCDSQMDYKLSGDTLRLIWAFSNLDSLEYHGPAARGVRSVYLQEPKQSRIDFSHDPSVKTWDLNSQVELPNDDHTHYWCRIFKAPELTSKHHMIALEPLIQEGHEAYVHHMVLYECHVEDAQVWFEQHVESKGAACYSPNMPAEWTFCLATNAWAWAVGSEGEILPDHVGMPLGESYGGATYFMLETHYDNPAIHQNIIDSSGIRIHYTNQLRLHDTAMLLVGSEVNFLHMIPPRQELFKTVGRCTSKCTSNSLPEDGIQILNGVLHSHLAGRKMRLRHIRNGVELPTILQDNHYDFNFQASRIPLENRGKVLPGDELILECDYSTKSRQSPTFGGLSTREEMCLGFILYYPRTPLADCRSLPSLKTVMKAFGIEAVYGQAFEKLQAFLQDIDGREESDTLQDLLQALAQELKIPIQEKEQRILSEDDLLDKPFYTVEEPQLAEPLVSNSFSLNSNQMPSLAEAQGENYRELLPQLLLSVKISQPLQYQNLSVSSEPKPHF